MAASLGKPKANAITKAAVPTAPVSVPRTPVRLEAPYAYYEDDGTLKNWAQGQVIHDADEIALLSERGARLVPHEVTR